MLLRIRDLHVHFETPEGLVRAVDGVDLDVDQAEAVGLVGESGCGKSVTALSILRLIPSPPGKISSGNIYLDGMDLLSLDREEIRKVRGRLVGMVFQEPMTSLNPVMTIGQQVAEPIMEHRGVSKREAMEQAAYWLEKVRIPAARQRMGDFPYQLSGGMRQRVMIAMALACAPKLLIADEPTTALDVTIQAQILSLIRGLKEELGMAVLLITHDLGVVAQMTKRVAVMYAGEVVEEAPVRELFRWAFHPYTQGLMRSMPPRDGGSNPGPKGRLREIPGIVPVLTEPIQGCRFKDRCAHAFEICSLEHPQLWEVADNHRARCWLKQYPEKRRPDA
ncbi:MAG: ABC transporter ATP-binding protein [bacterium]